MADLRIPSAQLPAAQPRGTAPARSDAVRAAQRAFFETALAGEAQAAPAARPTAAVEAAVVATPFREVRAAFDPATPAPTRMLRPGSLLDIKV